MKTKNVAAITMAYGEPFIAKWVGYYSAQFGPENVYVISHGSSRYHDEVCTDVNHITVPRIMDKNHDRHRARLMSFYANALLETHQCILVSDTDEIVAVDPDLGLPLKDYLLQRDQGAAAPLGFNVFGKDADAPLDWEKPVLQQAYYLVFHHGFCKPVIRWEVAEHSGGGHSLRDRKFEVDPNLYLFHLKFADAAAHEHFNEFASEVSGIADRRTMDHWAAGSSYVEDLVRRWSKNVGSTLDPRAGSDGCYEVVPAGARDRGAKVISLRPAKPFILKEKFRSLL